MHRQLKLGSVWGALGRTNRLPTGGVREPSLLTGIKQLTSGWWAAQGLCSATAAVWTPQTGHQTSRQCRAQDTSGLHSSGILVSVRAAGHTVGGRSGAGHQGCEALPSSLTARASEARSSGEGQHTNMELQGQLDVQQVLIRDGSKIKGLAGAV